MNQAIANKLRQGIAIAIKQFPWLRACDKTSGIYAWERTDENGVFCWYVGKAKNLLQRTAQHIMDGQSHLDKSIKAHGFLGGKEGEYGWTLRILVYCTEDELDSEEKFFIQNYQGNCPKPDKMYNIESGGTTGKTIIGEKKQRRDVKWKAEARAKVIAEYREYFDLEPKDNAFKKNTYLNELKAEPKKLKGEYYENSNQ